MIFVTVGTQLPFDRLVGAVDQWAAAQSQRPEIFAQTGESSCQFTSITWKPFLDHKEFREKFATADLIIAHAGMGSILYALQAGKPILVMPRRAELGEHRNDHQYYTARRLANLGYVNVAYNEHELAVWLERHDQIRSLRTVGAFAGPALLDAIRDFLSRK
jgi:UDP-N-acetylglucosamine transferase subunit ALG13